MSSIVSVKGLTKRYDSGFEALKSVDLEIEEGEIIALLGPNGAGKTTLISTICGITTATEGKISVGGYDTIENFRDARRLIGLVPQEVNLEPFEKVINTVNFSRGLFGKDRNPGKVDQILKDLTLDDKRDSRIAMLSGGMKRRVLIAKALVHEPRILFLDEPTAGVDVELRKDMWAIVERLRQDGVTIILTTHYIEEAEALADRIAVINHGEILLVEEKAALMSRLGQKELVIELTECCAEVPASLSDYALEPSADGMSLVYRYDAKAERTGITRLLQELAAAGLRMRDISTHQSSLEEIFVGLVREDKS